MSDAMSDREIEDVLSSIRRLVAREGAAPARGRLVLTEAQRIADNEGSAPVSLTDAAGPGAPGEGGHAESGATGDREERARIRAAIAGTAADEAVPGAAPVAQTGHESGHESDRESGRKSGHGAGGAGMGRDSVPEGGRQTAGPAESPVEAPVEGKTVEDAAPAPDAPPELPHRPPHRGAEHSGQGVSDDPARLHAARPESYEPTSYESVVSWQGAEAGEADPVEDEAQVAGDGARYEDGTDEADQADASALTEELIDEETLRALVAQLVREELRGQLGERITMQVRKLVRAEIARALDEREYL